MRMMLLLFLDDIKSERELMRIIPERLDYLWFLGYGLDDEIPEILSKVVYGKKAHPRLITVKQLVLAVPLHR